MCVLSHKSEVVYYSSSSGLIRGMYSCFHGGAGGKLASLIKIKETGGSKASLFMLILWYLTSSHNNFMNSYVIPFLNEETGH